jgi:serine/threonine-protein kinase
VAALLDQLLDALTTIHRAGVIHRDIKPANLLLKTTEEGAPYLLLSDFGIAAPVREPRLTHTDMVVGTRGYVAPEVMAKQEHGPDPRQDLYATGVTAIEMLTGSRVDEVEPERFVELAGPLTNLIVSLTSPDPIERLSSAPQAREMLLASGEVPPAGAVPDDGGTGVEVFDQLPDLPEGWRDPTTPMPRPSREATSAPPPPLHQSQAANATSPRPRNQSRRGAIVVSVAALVGGLALVAVALSRVL